MELLANDLSIHKQFHDIRSFRDALTRLMLMRDVARRFDHEVYCHRGLLTTNPMPDMSMQQAVGRLAVDERRAAMSWLTREGPFWDDLRQHDPDDYLECQDTVVTDTAVGEGAFRTLHGVDCGLVSVTPSDWDYSPIGVTWQRRIEGLNDRCAALENWRSVDALEDELRHKAPPIQSWDALRKTSINRFKILTFATDCFEPLDGIPFSMSGAKRFLILIDILDRFARAFDAAGVRTTEGHRIYQDHFTGENALFSDSSDSENTISAGN